MTKKWIVVAIGAAVLLGEQLPAKAQSSSTNGVAAKAFLEAVGCSQLPIGTCELLNADNAVNILATHRAALRQRYCGTMNASQARALVGMGTVSGHCRTLLELAGEVQPSGPDQRPDPNANRTTAAAPAAPPPSTEAPRQARAPQESATLFDAPLETGAKAVDPKDLFAMPVGGPQADPNANRTTAAAPVARRASSEGPPQTRAPQGFITLFDGPLEIDSNAVNPRDLFAMPGGGPKPEPYANYRAYDREASAVEVNVRRPGEPWEIVREGIPIGVTRLEDLLDITDAGQQLQIAGMEVEQQRLLREAQEREAARRAEQARREASERAEAQRRQEEYEREVRRQEQEAARERDEPGFWGMMAGALIAGAVQGYAESQGVYIPPALSYGGYGGGGQRSGSDGGRAACDRQIAAAASRLSGSSSTSARGSGICQGSQYEVKMYREVENAYNGCQQFYAAGYEATVRARKLAEERVRASCATGGASPGGGARPTGGSRPDDRYSCKRIGQLADGNEPRCDSAGREVALCFSDAGWVLEGNRWNCGR